MTHALPYTGRFAPSPTGDLHFGSLLAALASYLQAKSHAGRWILRIDDIDPQREVTGAAQNFVQDLAQFGMHPDGEVVFQSDHTEAYHTRLEQLLKRDWAFTCTCTRQSLPVGQPYPGHCRKKALEPASGRSVRIRTEAQSSVFHDGVRGRVEECLAETCGDFIIWRADGLPAYQLAAALDDAAPAMTEVVRGGDLLPSTHRQNWVRQVLGLESPKFAHLPVITHANKKLSKRRGSDPLAQLRSADALQLALRCLGHAPPSHLEQTAMLDWALQHWQLQNVPTVPLIRLEDIGLLNP